MTKYRDDGNARAAYTDDGAKHVSDGVSGALRSRLIPAAAVTHPGADTGTTNTNARTFTEAEGVRKVYITATPTTPTAGVNDYVNDFCDVVLDAPNGATEKVFLDEAGTGDSLSLAVVKLRVPLGIRTELPISTSAIRRVGVKPSVACSVLIEGY